MMTPLHCQATASILLFVLPTVASLVPRLSIRQIQAARNANVRKIARAAARKSTTQLSLGIDAADAVAQNAHHLHDLHHHAIAATNGDHASTLDFLSTFTLAKASVVPNHSVAPLTDTIKSAIDGNGVEVIPDLPSMPGGTPRSGNPFLAESFRELYDATLKSEPRTSWTNPGAVQYYGVDGSASSNALVVPAREWDVVARYADLLNRIPLAAAMYALVDFFLINAEEDLAIVELLDEEAEVEAIMEVERKVTMQRFLGLFVVVMATVGWSFLTYHPVPFNEL